MIKTKKIKLTAFELFKLFLIRYFKKKWWLFIGFVFLAILISFKEVYEAFDYFVFLMTLGFPLIIIIQFWRYVTSRDNKILLHERYYEIDDEKINGILDEETFSPIRIEHFIKVEVIQKTFLLYTAKNMFFYIPIDSFKSDDDLVWFKKEILSKIKK